MSEEQPEKARHTPGPWRFHDELILAGGHGRQGKTLAESPGQFHWETDPEWFANARLIAAAPELLAACKAMLEDPHARGLWPEGYHVDIDAGRAAIAKAEETDD
jgi:hypothetical protein